MIISRSGLMVTSLWRSVQRNTRNVLKIKWNHNFVHRRRRHFAIDMFTDLNFFFSVFVLNSTTNVGNIVQINKHFRSSKQFIMVKCFLFFRRSNSQKRTKTIFKLLKHKVTNKCHLILFEVFSLLFFLLFLSPFVH